MKSNTDVARLQAHLQGASSVEILKTACTAFPERVALASSMGLEDQVLTHLIAEHDVRVRIFTLDTGRLFNETYDLIERTEARYGLRIEVFSPDASEVEQMVRLHGVNLFRDSISARKRCCEVRKLRPLARALSGLDAWVCGLRQEQSVTREDVSAVELEDTNGLLKFNPLYDWTEEQVREFIAANDVPYNPLHDAGMPSIGCAPCTRAIAPGEHPRSGRWWWESPEQRECGLHARSTGA